MLSVLRSLIFSSILWATVDAHCHVKLKPTPETSKYTTRGPRIGGDDVKPRVAVEQDCPSGWEKRTFCGRRAPSCYKKIDMTKADWYFTYNTTNPCAKHHPDAQITSIHCLEEDDFIRNTYGPTTIGLHNEFNTYWSRNKFHWVDGTDIKFTNWATNQPDNLKVGEYHVKVGGSGSGPHWYDAICGNTTSAVCKIEFTRLRKYSPALYPCDYGFKFATACGEPKCMALVEENKYWKNKYCGIKYNFLSKNVVSYSCDDQIAFVAEHRWTPLPAGGDTQPWTLSLCEAPIRGFSEPDGGCPDGWVSGDFCNGSACYRTYLVPSSWPIDKTIDSSEFCFLFNIKANAASINCKEEDDFMQQFAYSFIGLTVSPGATSSSTFWSDGSPVRYRGFDPDAFDVPSNEKRYVSIMPGKGWGMYPESAVEQVICKIINQAPR